MAPQPRFLDNLFFSSSRFYISELTKRGSMSPLEDGRQLNLLQRRDDSGTKYNPGFGAQPARNFNNNGFLIMFALIGAGMAVACIWFFFIARNGGFHWRQNDWEDYKTTVLRRKGPDGKTLSNATKSTKLGGGSIVPKFMNRYADDGSQSSFAGDEEMAEAGRHRHHGNPALNGRGSNRHDPELHAYRHEKPARVGGINTQNTGSHYDYTNTDRSDASNNKLLTKKQKQDIRRQKKDDERREKDRRKQEAKDKKKWGKSGGDAAAAVATAAVAQRAPSSSAQSYTVGDDSGSNYTASQAGHNVPRQSPSYYNHYRPGSDNINGGAPTLRAVPEDRAAGSVHHQHPHRSSRQGSPRKQHRGSERYSADEGSFATSTTDTGTKVYPCHIPGLSKGEVGINDSISQVGGNNNQNRRSGPSSGYRRSRGADDGDFV